MQSIVAIDLGAILQRRLDKIEIIPHGSISKLLCRPRILDITLVQHDVILN